MNISIIITIFIIMTSVIEDQCSNVLALLACILCGATSIVHVNAIHFMQPVTITKILSCFVLIVTSMNATAHSAQTTICDRV